MWMVVMWVMWFRLMLHQLRNLEHFSRSKMQHTFLFTNKNYALIQHSTIELTIVFYSFLFMVCYLFHIRFACSTCDCANLTRCMYAKILRKKFFFANFRNSNANAIATSRSKMILFRSEWDLILAQQMKTTTFQMEFFTSTTLVSSTYSSF